MQAEGVVRGYGTNFFAEEVGWFRISFTATEEPLRFGLETLNGALNGLMKKG